MELFLPPDQEAFIRPGIEAGRFRGKGERERRRLEILAAVDQAEASLARGHGRRITAPEEVAQLTEDINRRGVARLAAEQNARR